MPAGLTAPGPAARGVTPEDVKEVTATPAPRRRRRSPRSTAAERAATPARRRRGRRRDARRRRAPPYEAQDGPAYVDGLLEARPEPPRLMDVRALGRVVHVRPARPPQAQRPSHGRDPAYTPIEGPPRGRGRPPLIVEGLTAVGPGSAGAPVARHGDVRRFEVAAPRVARPRAPTVPRARLDRVEPLKAADHGDAVRAQVLAAARRVAVRRDGRRLSRQPRRVGVRAQGLRSPGLVPLRCVAGLARAPARRPRAVRGRGPPRPPPAVVAPRLMRRRARGGTRVEAPPPASPSPCDYPLDSRLDASP